MIGTDSSFIIGGAHLRQWTVDAFATTPFRGNPACVVEPFEAWPTAAWMQALAAENAQAETAYLLWTDDPARFGLRWFTPTLEAPLCGHATLAAAHVLFGELGAKVDELVFETQSAGELRVRKAARGYVMDFPADPPRPVAGSEALTRALGVAPLEVWAGQYLVAVLADEATVRALKPDLAALASLGGEAGGGVGNVVVVAPADADAGYDVVDRFFAPGSGIPEDPTTGSAHCMLTPLYEPRVGHSPVRFHQAYPGRGGDLICAVQGDRVRLEGEAITVIESRLRLRPA